MTAQPQTYWSFEPAASSGGWKGSNTVTGVVTNKKKKFKNNTCTYAAEARHLCLNLGLHSEASHALNRLLEPRGKHRCAGMELIPAAAAGWGALLGTATATDSAPVACQAQPGPVNVQQDPGGNMHL